MNKQTQTLRVLHVIDSLAPGGAERMLIELVNALQAVSVEPSVCITRQDLTLATKVLSGIQVYRLDRKNTWDIKALIQFRKLVKALNIQIFHAHGYTSFLFVVLARFTINRKISIVLHAHNSLPPSRLVCFLGRIGANHFIGVSSEQLFWARQYMRLPEKKMTLLGNTIDIRPFQTAKPLDLSQYFDELPKYIGIIVANVLPVKNFELLFHAIALSKYRSSIGLLVAGSTESNDYFQTCKHCVLELGLQNQVVFLGMREDVPEILSSVDFGLLSSVRETGPVAVLEYMAAGLLFVATSVGQIAQKVAAAGLPGIVPVNDPIAFAGALDELLTLSEKERAERVEQGQQLLKNCFDIRDRVADLEAIYRQLVYSEHLSCD